MEEENTTQTGSGNSSGSGNEGHEKQTSGGQQPDTDTITLSRAKLSERLDRAAKTATTQAINELLGQLGVSSPDELKMAIEKARASESEAERVNRERAAEQAEREKLTRDLDTLRTKDRERRIQDALMGAMDELSRPDKDGIPGTEPHSRRQVVDLLRNRLTVKDEKVLVLRDGDVDHGAKLTDLVKSFYAENPFHVRSNVRTGGAGSTPEAGTGGTRTPEKATDRAVMARKFEEYRRRGVL